MNNPIKPVSPGEFALAQAIDHALNPGDRQEEPSLREKLLQRAQEAGSVSRLRQIIIEAEAAGRTEEIVQLFVTMVRKGDEIGIRRFSFTRQREEARREWFSLPWKVWEANLQDWAEDDDSAREVVDTIRLFGENTLLRDLLREVVAKVERPCRGVSTYGLLFTFLESLAETKLAQRIENPRTIPKHGVVIERGRDILLYLPVRGIQVSILGWPFVREAQERTVKHGEEQEKRAQELWAEATPGLTPNAVSVGKEGKLCLILRGHNRRVLIEVRKENSQMLARVAKAVGVRVTPLPSDWVTWSPEKDYVPLRGHWPLPEIPQTLKAWEDKLHQFEEEKQTKQERAKEEFQKVLESVTSLATLPIPFEEQAVTRLLLGKETGVAALFHWNFQWAGKTGLLAIALERVEVEGAEKFRIREVVSDFSYPLKLRGKLLPEMELEKQEDGSLKVRYAKYFRQMKPETYQALMMMLKFIQMRLNAEHRALSGEPAPSGNNHTG